MRWIRIAAYLLCASIIRVPGAWANMPDDARRAKRIESLYCTLLLDPELDVASVNRRISVQWIPLGTVRPASPSTPEQELAGKMDVLFRRVQEVLEMRPPSAHVTIYVKKSTDGVQAAHNACYGTGTPAIAFYIFEDNAIYASVGRLSEEVIAHEMAHCIMDHFFGMRPPRQMEEMMAVYATEKLR